MNLVPVAEWSDVYALAVGDDVGPQPEGVSNDPHQGLLNRIEYLKNRLTPKTLTGETTNSTVGDGHTHALEAASQTVAGVAKLTTDALARAFTDQETVLTPYTHNQALKGTNQNLAATGYQKLPGGLIIQWGRCTNAANYQDVTFPTAFPTALLSLAIADEDEEGTGGTGTVAAYYNATKVGFRMSKQTDVRPYWIAIGY